MEECPLLCSVSSHWCCEQHMAACPLGLSCMLLTNSRWHQGGCIVRTLPPGGHTVVVEPGRGGGGGLGK